MKWRNPFKKNHITERKAVMGTSDALGAFLIFGKNGSGSTPSSALSLYEDSTAVSVPINMIAEPFASITPVLKTDGKIINKAPVLEFLSNPSPYFTQDLFLETIAKDYLITGESEIVAIGGVNRPPLELQPISPKNVSVIESTNGTAGSFIVSGNTLPGQYNFVRAGKRVRYLDGNLRELQQIRNFSTKNNSMLRGQSLLLAASAEARQHIKGNEHNVNILENGGRIFLVFNFDADLNDDEFEDAKERVMAQYGGSSKAGTIGVTAGGKLDIKEMGLNNRDMDFVKLQETAKTAVALQYKLPLPLITVKASTFNNYQEAKLALYDDAVLPLADRIFAGLSQLLLPRFGMDPSKVQITYDIDQITALVRRRNEELKLRREINLETDNELRTLLGREEVEGGNTLRAPANMVPIASDLFTDDNRTTPKPGLARDNVDTDLEDDDVTEE